MNRCCAEMYLDDVETGSEWLTRNESRRALTDCLTGTRYEGGVTLFQASMRNVGTCRPDAKGESSDEHHKGESTDAGHRGGDARSREEGTVMGLDRRGVVVSLSCVHNQQLE